MERKDVMAKNVSMYKSQASALEQHAAPNCKGGEQEMEVDTITSDVQPSGKSTLLELEIFCYLIVLLFLIDQKMHNEETLMNLLLCNYLHYNLYDQAEKLRSKAPSFGAHSNKQATQEQSWKHEAYLLFPFHLDGTLLDNLTAMKANKALLDNDK